MTQVSLWQTQTESAHFSELCNALYQREVNALAKGTFGHCQALQARLKSLPHYISLTAHAMVNVELNQQSPLALDVQNASWSAKQGLGIPLSGQDQASINTWYLKSPLHLGLVVPVLVGDTIVLDCIDRFDLTQKRLRTNGNGWFSLAESQDIGLGKTVAINLDGVHLLKPVKKVMIAACAGHCWRGNSKRAPIMPTLRELLLSCSIDWKNLRKTHSI